MATTRGMSIWISMFLLICGMGAAQTSAVPPLVKFSGTVEGQSKTVGITFALYRDEEGGSPLWLETQNVQLDANGRYTVLLGATQKEGLPLEIFSGGETRWLGVKPEGQGEQARVLLVSVPYALKARDAETLGGMPVSAFVQSNFIGTRGTAAQSESGPTLNILDTGLSAGTTNQIAKWVNSTTLGNSLLFDNGTNVGINTTTPAATLDVNGTAIFRSFSTTFATTNNFGPQFAFTNSATPTGASWRFGIPGFANATSFFIYDYVSQNAPFTMERGAGANSLYFKNGGTVGIGTATPASKLTVAGTVESTAGGFKFPDASTQLTAGIAQSAADTRYLALSGGALTGSLSATSFNGNGSSLTNLNAANLSGTIPSNLLNGTYSNPLTFNNVSNSFSGNGAGLTNLSAANLSGTVNSSNLPPEVAYRNMSNSFSATQFLNSGAFVGVVGTGNSGTALNINNNDTVNPTIKINNNGGGDYLTMDGSGNGHFAFHGDGYFESNGWAPSIPYDSVGNPVSPGQIVKFTAAGTVVPMATTDNTGAIGIVAQTIPADQNNPTQSETVLSGVANCLFDNTAVVGDYVNISSTSAGKCHDVGPNLPNVGQVLGRVVEVNNGKNQVYLAGGSEIRMAPFFVRKLKLFSQSTALATTTLFTAGLSGTYRVSVYLDSGNTASGTITANLGWTDDIGAQSATVGTITPSQQYDSKTMVVRALVGNNITYSTQFSGVSGTPSYNLIYIIELIETD